MNRPLALALIAGLGGACGNGGGRAMVDAETPEGRLIPAGPFKPATIRFRPGTTTAAFLECTLDGAPVEYGTRVLVDECVECQCTTYGLRCRKRGTCPDDRCVFIDGQVVPQGGTAIVETCFDCTCDSTGPTCRRRTDTPCPVDGCVLGATEIASGAQRFVSECHACTCDANAGLLCTNLCHPECICNDCPMPIPDQDRVELGCGSPVCDYGSLVGAPGCK